MKRKTALKVIVGCIILLYAFAIPAQSCVNRILTLSVNGSIEQKLIGQMLATYITERTGTTVNLTTALDIKASESLVEHCKADIFLTYINVGMAGMDAVSQSKNTLESYALVKQYYLDKNNMIVLKPLGYKGPLMNDAGKEVKNRSLVVPVTTSDVLNRFPVLDRVINKLGGRIDDIIMEQLMEKAEADGVDVTIRSFLKNQHLI